MARTVFSKALIRVSSPSIISPKAHPFALPRLVNRRNRSSQSEKAQLIEVDLDPDGEMEVLGMRRLEDAIHGIIVRRSAPDWLPFLPGSSYWVPPRRRPYGIAELVGKLAVPMTEDESLSLTTVRGWPSSAYFIEGKTHPIKVKTNSKSPSHSQSESDDEEG